MTSKHLPHGLALQWMSVSKKMIFFYFCQGAPTFDETLAQFEDRVYEAELEGIVTIQNGIVRFA